MDGGPPLLLDDGEIFAVQGVCQRNGTVILYASCDRINMLVTLRRLALPIKKEDAAFGSVVANSGLLLLCAAKE